MKNLDFFVEFDGKQVLHKDLVEKIKDVWKESGKFVKDIKALEIYYKPSENTCYFVINQKEKGSIPV